MFMIYMHMLQDRIRVHLEVLQSRADANICGVGGGVGCIVDDGK